MVLRILCLLLAFAATVSVRSADVERDLARLDSCIQMKAQFDKQKEDRLQVLKDNLKSATDGNARYSVLYRLNMSPITSTLLTTMRVRPPTCL